MVTINKRETSYEGLVSKFQAGEDGVYNLIIENDKNIILTPKVQITKEEFENIPELKQLQDAIKVVEEEVKQATGKRKYLLKKQLIQMRSDQYVIRNSINQRINCLNGIKNFNFIKFDDNIIVQKDGTVIDNSLCSFMNPKHVSVLLCNYSKLKEDCYGKIYTDGYYLMWDFEDLIDRALKKDYPLYYKLVIYKIDGKQNIEIQKLLQQQFKTTYSIEYISTLWRQKIPLIIALTARKEYQVWYFTVKEKGKWKKCSKCGQIKLAHNDFFSFNLSGKDGFYSICKKCRNQKAKQKKTKKPKIIKFIPYKKRQGKEL